SCRTRIGRSRRTKADQNLQLLFSCSLCDFVVSVFQNLNHEIHNQRITRITTPLPVRRGVWFAGYLLIIETSTVVPADIAAYSCRAAAGSISLSFAYFTAGRGRF